MTTRKGLFIFCIQIIVVLTKYTAGFQNETTDDYLTTTNSNGFNLLRRRSLSVRFDEEDEFVWESMNLDEIQNFRYYGFNSLPRRSLSDRFDEEAIDESEAIHLLKEELEDQDSWLISINESEAIHLLNEEFEDLYSRLISINESEAGHIINEEFEDPYNWFISINESEAGHLLNKEFEDLYSWLISINESEAGHLINEEFEDPYNWFIYCSPEIYEPKMLEYKVAFTTRFIEDGPLSWIQLEICDTKELNYKTSMESLHGIESTALLATFIFTVLSMRIVSEEQLIKDTVSHSLIVKTTTKEARQNLPTKAAEEAVRHCELCINHDQAIAYCMTCKLYICMPCNGLHKRVWTLMNHTVCPFNHM